MCLFFFVAFLLNSFLSCISDFLIGHCALESVWRQINKERSQLFLMFARYFFCNSVSVIQLLSCCCDHGKITKSLRHFMKSSYSNILYPALLLTSCFCPGRTVLQTLGSWALYVSGYQHFLQVSVSSCLSSGLCLVQQDVRHLLHRPREPPATDSRMCWAWTSQSAHRVTLLIVHHYRYVLRLNQPVCAQSHFADSTSLLGCVTFEPASLRTEWLCW